MLNLGLHSNLGLTAKFLEFGGELLLNFILGVFVGALAGITMMCIVSVVDD